MDLLVLIIEPSGLMKDLSLMMFMNMHQLKSGMTLPKSNSVQNQNTRPLLLQAAPPWLEGFGRGATRTKFIKKQGGH